MADITFSGDSDFSKVQKDFDDLSRRTAKLEKENYRLKQSADNQANSFGKARAEQGSMLSKGITGITQMVAGYISLQAAVQLVTNAIREQREAQKGTLDAQVNQAQEDAKLIQNLAAMPAPQKAQVIQGLEAVSLQEGISDAKFVKAGFNEAISKSAGDADLAMDSTRRAAQLQRATPEQIPTFAAGGAVLSRLLDTKDSREAFALMNSAQSIALSSTAEELMNTMPGAIAAMIATDERQGTPEQKEAVRESTGLFVAMQQGAKQSADATRTASIQFSSQLAEFFKGGTQDIDDKIGKLQERKASIQVGGVKGSRERFQMDKVNQELDQLRTQRAAVKVEDPGTALERIDALQKNKALQDRFLANLTGEVTFTPFMEQLVRGTDTEVVKLYDQAVGSKEAGGLSIDVANFEQQKTELGAQSPVSKAVRMQAAIAQTEADKQSFQLKNDDGAKMALIREKFDNGLQATGEGINIFLENGLQRAEFLFSQFGSIQDAAAGASDLLVEQEKKVRSNRQGVMGSLSRYLGDPGVRLRPMDELSESERTRVEAIRKARDDIREIGDLSRSNKRAPALGPEPARPMATQGLRGVTDWLLPGAAIPEDPQRPGTGLSRRAANLTPRPTAAGETAQRSAAGQANAQTAAAAVDLSSLQATNEQQLAKLDQLNTTMGAMVQSFSRTAARMAGVAAKSEMLAANA